MASKPCVQQQLQPGETPEAANPGLSALELESTPLKSTLNFLLELFNKNGLNVISNRALLILAAYSRQTQCLAHRSDSIQSSTSKLDSSTFLMRVYVSKWWLERMLSSLSLSFNGNKTVMSVMAQTLGRKTAKKQECLMFFWNIK